MDLAALARGAARAREAPARGAARRSTSMDACRPFLVAATRLGGRHGYDDADAPAPDGRRGDRLRQGVPPRAREPW